MSALRYTSFVCAAAALLVAARTESRPVRLSASWLTRAIVTLSAPDMTGRGAGTAGLDKAADWLEKEFEAAGLQPVFNGSYRQQVPIAAEARLGSNNLLQCDGCASELSPVAGTHFLPMPMSASGDVAADLVFAGYGIDAPECGYSDYEGVDVRGRVVLILRHEPQEYEGESVFEGRIYSEHSQIYRKLLVAKERGAAAVLITEDSASHGGQNRPLEFNALPGPGSVGIPIVQITPDLVDSWFAGVGRDFKALQRQIDEDLRPRSFAMNVKLRLRADVTHRELRVWNIAGYAPGTTSEYVIAGAHYDHLGLGEQYSMAQDQTGTVHPGADDNASGTASIVALARWFGKQERMKRGVLFIAFSGEEIGLLGSTYYALSPGLKADDAVAMINLDMVGKLREDKLIVGGAGSAREFSPMLRDLQRLHKLDLQMGEDVVYGSSDHTVFRARGLPVLFFFTGLHGDYHRPSDTADKIDGKNVVRVAEFAGDVLRRLASDPSRVTVVLPKEKAKKTLKVQGTGR